MKIDEVLKIIDEMNAPKEKRWNEHKRYKLKRERKQKINKINESIKERN